MILAALAAARLVHFAAAMLLFGGWLYALLGLRGPVLGGLAQRTTAALRPLLLWAGVASLASGAAWAALTVANIGGGLASAFDGEIWGVVLGETDFGRVWAGRLVLGLVLVLALVAARRSASPALDGAAAGLGALSLLTLSLLGHTQVEEGAARLGHVAADALHLAGASAWLGGLAALALLLRASTAATLAEVHAALGRFSCLGYLAVGALALSGLVNGWFLVGDPRALLSTPYGLILSAKLVLFALMLALAAANRLRVTAAVQRAAEAGEAPRTALAAIRRNVALEQALGAAILALVAVLGVIEPARGMG